MDILQYQHQGMLKALNRSIASYEIKIKVLTKNIGKKLEPFIDDGMFGGNNCPMCRYSNLNGTDGCDLCIIGHAFDDNRSCRNTLYDFIQDILDTSTSKEKVTKKFISLVEDELEYLRDLKVRYLQSRRDDAKI